MHLINTYLAVVGKFVKALSFGIKVVVAATVVGVIVAATVVGIVECALVVATIERST